ncbi:hypothetical protein GCM10009727_11170 [Actinomadura napierensis]|uniref:Uncharacterized protein n=1 Tax=Actinomadura napierensis TaxID=267854 RepID=A0ABP5K2X6_9ACTN
MRSAATANRDVVVAGTGKAIMFSPRWRVPDAHQPAARPEQKEVESRSVDNQVNAGEPPRKIGTRRPPSTAES